MRLKLISLLFIPFASILLMSHNTYADTVTVEVDKTSFNGTISYRSYVGSASLGNIDENVTNLSQNGNYPFYMLSTQSAKSRYLWNFTNNYTITNPDNYSGANLVVQDTLEYRGVNNTNVFSSQQYKHSVIMTFTDNSTSTYDCYTGDGVIWSNISNGNGYLYAQCVFVAQKPLKSFVHRVGNESFSTANSIVAMGVGQGNGLYAYSGWYSGDLYIDEVPVVLPQLDNISNQLDDLSQNINDHYEAENDAVDNISNQTPPASGSGENSTTSSLLDTLGSFLTAITNLSATNCEVVLAFPAFAGGSQTVNICQNKEYTGNIVSIAGSIILVLFYLPVAFMLVNKIYSEIRSFTNG